MSLLETPRPEKQTLEFFFIRPIFQDLWLLHTLDNTNEDSKKFLKEQKIRAFASKEIFKKFGLYTSVKAIKPWKYRHLVSFSSYYPYESIEGKRLNKLSQGRKFNIKLLRSLSLYSPCALAKLFVIDVGSSDLHSYPHPYYQNRTEKREDSIYSFYG